MFNDVHSDFILNPLTEVLSAGVCACSSLPVGIENSALGEYFMQSLFLRMTGAQEQKLKCVCWALATNDYKYRYDYLNKKQYGECSDYKAKNDIYNDLFALIRGINSKFTPFDAFSDIVLPDKKMVQMETQWKRRVDGIRMKEAERAIEAQKKKGAKLSPEAEEKIRVSFKSKPYPNQDWEAQVFNEKKASFIKQVVADIVYLLEHSPLTAWNYREFLIFKEHWQDVLNSGQLLVKENELFASKLQGYYRRLVYEHRNKTAHNTASYVKDMPTLGVLSDKGNVYNNYYFRFAILILIDEVFMRMFKRYREEGLKMV